MSVNKYIYWYSIILFPFILKKWKQHWMKRSICFCLVQVLLGITSRGSDLKFFHPRNLLPTECLTVIIDIMRETGEIKPSLIIKCLQLLRNLGKIGYHEDGRPYFNKKKIWCESYNNHVCCKILLPSTCSVESKYTALILQVVFAQLSPQLDNKFLSSTFSVEANDYYVFNYYFYTYIIYM